ncbi:MAG: 16S rRNA (adenine(1518)-N(6)/adenine(1519)-N(6))-dimethyltransferase RsmA [Gemmatimonadota bacterium]
MRAKRSLGQNFLVDPNLQRKIVEAVAIEPGDTVVEIGPGRGALTEHLAAAAPALVAVELDPDLAERLQERFRHTPSVRIVHADVLEWDPGEILAHPPVRVVGNIPYNITSPILFRLLEWRPRPESMVVMVQTEVADRLRADPGEKAYGALTVGVRAAADVEKLFDVGRQAFRPVPNVDSAVVRIRPGATHRQVPEPVLRSLTRAAFGMRRKQLQKILRTAPGYGLEADRAEAVLREVGVSPRSRPETLAPDTFVELAAALRRLGYPGAGEDT